jgi:hypothetical protein
MVSVVAEGCVSDISNRPTDMATNDHKLTILPKIAMMRFSINPGAIIARKKSDIIIPDSPLCIPASDATYEVLYVTISEV